MSLRTGALCLRLSRVTASINSLQKSSATPGKNAESRALHRAKAIDGDMKDTADEKDCG